MSTKTKDKVKPEQKLLKPIRGGTEIQLNTEVLTRYQALSKGLVLYWNGKPCEKGHVSPRYAKSGHCKKCYQMFRNEEIDQSEISKDKLPKKEAINDKIPTVEDAKQPTVSDKDTGNDAKKRNMRRTIAGLVLTGKKRIID